MADATERQLKILLKLAADTSTAESQLTGSLKRVEDQANRTAGAVTKIDYSKIAQDRASASAAMNAGEEKSIANQAAIALQMERRVIMETQLEAAEARIAGNTALAANLEREAVIRAKALGIQNALNISTEESIVLSERMVVAQEATAVAANVTGVNYGKAKAEAIILGREIATGTVNARTLSALLGSLGSTLTIAGIAGYGLYEIIAHAADEALHLAQEVDKQTDTLIKQVQHWKELAAAAKNFGDVVHLGADIDKDLTAMSAKLTQFRSEELSKWQQWGDTLSHLFLSAIPGFGPRPNEDARNAALSSQTLLLQQALQAGNAAYDAGQKAVAVWKQFENLPPSEGIAYYSAQVDKLREKMASLEELRHKSASAFTEYEQAGKDIVALTGHIDELTKKQEQLDKKDAGSERKNDQLEFNNLLRGESILLTDIRQQQQLIASDPFLSVQAKNEQLVALYQKEQATILVEILKLKAQIAVLESVGGPKEQGEVQQLTQKLHALGFEYQTLGKKVQTLSFSGGLRAELTDWVNSFGTAAQQIGHLIEGSINTALQSTNQLLLDAAFKTGDWKQTLQGAERQILNLFLTWIEQMALQEAAQLFHIGTTTTAQAASGAVIAGSHAPAAAAVSISSYGAAAIVGEVLAVAAIAAIIAALTGGFEQGGYTGNVGEKQIAGVVHGGEYVFSKTATDAIGIKQLETLHSLGLRGYGTGGYVQPAGNFRIMGLGPGAGDFNRAANYGPDGQHYQNGDAVLSGNLRGVFHVGEVITIGGQQYTVKDFTSYLAPGRQTSGTIELYSTTKNLDQGRQPVYSGGAQVVQSGGNSTPPSDTPPGLGDPIVEAQPPSAPIGIGADGDPIFVGDEPSLFNGYRDASTPVYPPRGANGGDDAPWAQPPVLPNATGNVGGTDIANFGGNNSLGVNLNGSSYFPWQQIPNFSNPYGGAVAGGAVDPGLQWTQQGQTQDFYSQVYGGTGHFDASGAWVASGASGGGLTSASGGAEGVVTGRSTGTTRDGVYYPATTTTTSGGGSVAAAIAAGVPTIFANAGFTAQGYADYRSLQSSDLAEMAYQAQPGAPNKVVTPDYRGPSIDEFDDNGNLVGLGRPSSSQVAMAAGYQAIYNTPEKIRQFFWETTHMPQFAPGANLLAAGLHTPQFKTPSIGVVDASGQPVTSFPAMGPSQSNPQTVEQFTSGRKGGGVTVVVHDDRDKAQRYFESVPGRKQFVTLSKTARV